MVYPLIRVSATLFNLRSPTHHSATVTLPASPTLLRTCVFIPIVITFLFTTMIQLRLASWNVCGMSSEHRVNLIVNDLESYNVSVIGIQETKVRSGRVEELPGGHRLILFGQENGWHGGLGFLINKSFTKYVQSFSRVSDRVAYVDVEIPASKAGRPATRLRLVNAYSPTNPKSIDNPLLAHRFYDDITRASDVPARHELFFLGDFNAKVGKRSEHDTECGLGEHLGRHSVGRRNENGRRLLNFCASEGLFVANSAFKHSSRHITTRTGWIKDQQTGLTRPYYAQIDYILCRTRSRASLKNARSYAGTIHRSEQTNKPLPPDSVYMSHGTQHPPLFSQLTPFP